MECAFKGCDRESASGQWCKLHGQRVRRHGSPYLHCRSCGSEMLDDRGRRPFCADCEARRSCSIEGCDRKPQGRGYCKYHWKKWRLYGDPLGSSDYKQVKRDCSVDGCEKAYHANGYCSFHGYRAERYGDPLAIGPGKRSGRKRMGVPSYAGIHKRLFYDLGQASRRTCVDCGGRADEWSYNGGADREYWEDTRGSLVAYTTDFSFYSPRCVRCHRIYDFSTVRERGTDGRFISSGQ